MSQRKRKKEPPPTDVRWWSTKIAKTGAAVGGLVLLFTTAVGILSQFDARYALAADVQQIQSDVLELRRDSLDQQRREIQRAQRQRKLSDVEIERLQKLNDEISKIDRRLEKIEGGAKAEKKR